MLLAAGSAPLAHAVPLADLAKRQRISLDALLRAAGVRGDMAADAVITAELELKYAGYFERERVQAARLQRMGDFSLGAWLDYGAMRSLSTEARQKLAAIRPLTLAQAARIPGISPSDLQNLMIEVAKRPASNTGVSARDDGMADGATGT
jgi:tRNA uridine 5-carboxymethylaminomethyl modification enzyme